MKYISTVARFISLTTILTIAVLPTNAQSVGDVSYRQTRSEGGRLYEISRNSLGRTCDGRKIEDIPGGAIFEVTSLGNGYYKAKSFITGKVGSLDNSVEVKAKIINPRQTIGKTFDFWRYEQECPSLGDLPKAIDYLTISPSSDESAPDEAIVTVTTRIDPDTKNEKRTETKYFGKFLPYCIFLDSIDSNGIKKPIDIVQISVGAHEQGGQARIYGIYVNGHLWNEISN